MDKNTIFECQECGLHYIDTATAESCKAWCKETKSCNLAITKKSVEAAAQQTKTTNLEEGSL